MRLISVKSLVSTFAIMGLLAAVSASAATYSVSGNVRMFNPSAGNVNAGAVVGQQGLGLPPRPTTYNTVDQGAGGAIVLPEKFWQADGWPNATANGQPDARLAFRSFPVFPCCAQLTYNSKTYNAAATLADGAGAGNLQWCPKATGCANFSAGTLKPARVAYQAGANQYGGVVKLLRNVTGQVWFIKAEAPVLSVSAQANTLVAGDPGQGGLFSGGITNYATVMDINLPGKLYTGGALTQPGGVL